MAEIKLDLINKIAKLKETRIIEDIHNILDFKLDEGIFQISDLQKSRLTAAKNDKVITW